MPIVPYLRLHVGRGVLSCGNDDVRHAVTELRRAARVTLLDSVTINIKSVMRFLFDFASYICNGQFRHSHSKGLVTNYGEGGGGLQNGRGGHVKFYPYEKGGRKSFSHAEGGGQNVSG